MLDKHNQFGYPESVTHSFTGSDGIMMKSATMDAFTSYTTIDGLKDGPLQKIQILPLTSCANCGISSNELNNAFHEGFLITLYKLLQEMGRGDRKMSNIPGTCTYQVYVSFSSYVSLFIRIMPHKDK